MENRPTAPSPRIPGSPSAASPSQLLEELAWRRAEYRMTGEDATARLLVHPEAKAGQLLAAARLCFASKRVARSAQLTARSVLLDGHADTRAIHASNLERMGQLTEAREFLADGLARDPQHARSVRLLARIDRRENRLEEARGRLERQLRDAPGPDDWRLRYELAAVLDRLGEHRSAFCELEKAKRQLAPRAEVALREMRIRRKREADLLALLTPDLVARWRGASSPPFRIGLMTGFPRSGTTLLEDRLVAGTDCLGTDESGILQNEFIDPLIHKAGSAGEALAELDSFEESALAAGREEYLRATSDLLGESPGGRLLLEKDPLLTSGLALPLRLFPSAKLLMPLRDPRDVVISYFFTLVPLAGNSASSISLRETAHCYRESMAHWQKWRDELLPDGVWMESRYEDLVAGPEATLTRVRNFLGLAHPGSGRAAERAGKTISTPTYADARKPFHQNARGRWIHYQEQLDPILPLLREPLSFLGYEDSVT